jgi:CubicO group peptidase (beta-lactamase class C family)
MKKPLALRSRWHIAAATLCLLIAVRISPQTPVGQAEHVKSAKELEGAIAQIDTLVAAEYANQKAGSITVGVISGGELIWTKSYGLADMEVHRPATKDTTYRIGSISKQFAGIMLLQLVEQGKVRLSDPVTKYYPEFNQVPNPQAYPTPTLLQLAAHTSGLDSEPDNSAKYTTGQVADWDKTLLAALPYTKFKYEPGTHEMNSNIGCAILGEALSRAAGEPYVEYVLKHILKPLGMSHAAFEQNDEVLRTLAKGYLMNENSADPRPAADELAKGRGYKVPAGALLMPIGDLARFVSFEMGYGPESVLSKAVLSENFSHVYGIDGDMTFGAGVAFTVYRQGTMISFGQIGSVSGYQAAAFFSPRSHTGVIIMRNFESAGAREDVTLALAANKILADWGF